MTLIISPNRYIHWNIISQNAKLQDFNVILASAASKTLGANRTNRQATPEHIIIR